MISVIMSTYNEKEEYLVKAIESVLSQTYQNFEFVIILDNPENDKLRNILNYYARIEKKIKLIFNENNLGLTASLNKGLKIARGNYIARMDADDIADIFRLEKQLSYLEKYDLDIVGSQLRRISESGKVVNECTNKSYDSECVLELLNYDNCIPHPSWLVKKDVYERLKGYKEITACEDYDFLLRAKMAGYKIGIADDILMNYRINTKGISRNNSLRQLLSAHYLQKNMYRIDTVNKTEVDQFVERYNTKNAAEQYEKALKKMNLLLEGIKNGNKMLLMELPLLVLMSKFIILNYKKIYTMNKIKKKYERRHRE